MSDEDLLTTLLDQLGALAAGMQSILDNQEALSAELDQQGASLAALGVAMGMTYHATGADAPLPADVLEDRAFERFLNNYPIDGPPIVGKTVMEAHLAKLDKVDRSKLAAGFRDLARQVDLSMIERIRNKQIERIARERYGDLEAIEKGRTVTRAPSREAER